MKLDSLKAWVIGASIVLGLIAVSFFVAAIFTRDKLPETESNTLQIHVYINDNDSIVNKLQQDVSHLSNLIEGFQSDTLVITRTRPLHPGER